MPVPIICLDENVCHFAERFRQLLSKPQYQYFVIVLLGLMQCEGGRTLSGLLRQIGAGPSLAGLSRFFSEAPWEAKAVAERPLEALSRDDAAAGGQYHLHKEKFAKGGIGMILEKRKSFDGKKDMILSLDLETGTRAFDDARVEAQTALRQEPIAPTEVLDQAGRQIGLAGDRQASSEQQPIGDHFDGVGQTDTIRVHVGEASPLCPSGPAGHNAPRAGRRILARPRWGSSFPRAAGQCVDGL
jgi:hypothetical protein